MAATHTARASRSFRSAALDLLCDHGGRCDGPKTVGRARADQMFVPCLGLAVSFHAAAGHRTKPQKAADAAERAALEAAGWALLRLREKPLKTEGDTDVPFTKAATPADLTLAIGRATARLHATGKFDVPASVLARIHDTIRPAPKPPKSKSGCDPKPKGPPAWIAELDGKGVVLLDLDGTTYDSWACCGVNDHKRSGKSCIHVRRDTLTLVRDLCEREDAVVVVLSWRSGEYGITLDWLKEVEKATGFKPHTVLVPDHRSPLPTVKRRADLWGQVAFKVEVAEALMALGVRIVGSFDDAQEVADAMRELDVPYVHQVPHLVKVSDYEWTMGRLGAERPSYRSGKVGWAGYRRQGGFLDGVATPADEHGNWCWDGDAFSTADSEMSGPQDETDFLERLDAGDAVYGRDYTVDERGGVVPLFDSAPELAGMHVVGAEEDDDLADEAARWLREHAGA